MRAIGRDISELFGFAPDDMSEEAINYWRTKMCPFRGGVCTKFNHDRSVIYGVCSVTNGANKEDEVIVCPKRLYAESFLPLRDVVSVVWPNEDCAFVADGSTGELFEKARSSGDNYVIAFGQGSGNELSVSTANGKLSMDWVLQRYKNDDGKVLPHDFVGIEVQSIDITGNYRDAHAAYSSLKSGELVTDIPNSGHGLNWANVHKRLIPQIIRKGNVYREMDRCAGFFFVLPDTVFKKFEEVLGFLPERTGPRRDRLSILTYSLESSEEAGSLRKLKRDRIAHYDLDDIITAFSSNSGKEPALELEKYLQMLS
ncbi:TPA: NotI family restriction endonuclease [Vibrio parahaemolyticus]